MSITVPFINDIVDTNDVQDYECEYDELEYGIEINDNQQHNNEITNPFYVSQKGGNIKSIGWGDIYRNFNSVIIMTLCDYMKPENINVLFKTNLIKDELKSVKNIMYFRTGINILKNKDHYYKSVIVNKNELLQLFPDGQFNESEIVLSIFEMNETNTRKYCDMYKSTNDIQEIETKLEMYTYYLGDKKNLDYLNIELNDMFKNLKESDYWSDKKNLDINITTSFIDREFNNQRTSTSFQVINQNENKIFNKIVNNYTSKSNDYPVNNSSGCVKKGKKDYPIDDFKHSENKSDNKSENKTETKHHIIKKKDIFVDPSSIIRKEKSDKKRTFFSTILDNKNINNDYVLNLYNMLNNHKLKYNFVNSLLVSKEYCHLILNNRSMLDQITPMIEKYKHVFKYTVGYTWLNFYLEECLARTKSTKKSRFVFDINTANKLPVFPYVYSDIKQNPYITILTDDIEILYDNTFGMSYIDGYDGYGVTDLATFQKRFNIFTTGNSEITPFVGLDWSKFGVSGSAITACLQKRSVLLDQMIKKYNNDETEGFKQFVKKYYSDSDVDLMSNESSIVSFLDSVKTVYELLQKNLNATPNETRFESVKTFAISITSYFFEYYLKDFNETYNFNKTQQEFESMTNDILFKTYVYTKYINSKMLTNKKIFTENNNRENVFLKEYMIPNSYEHMNIYKVDYTNYETYDVQDSDVLYYRNDFGNTFPAKENHMVMKISENIRYKLFCKNTKIETFRIRDKEFFSTVARFHFPCVRAYYQGDNVFILPSCISAMMTGLNIEYKYFAGVRNPVDIINKYMQRGFGVLLNKYEINIWLEYNKNEENKTNIKYDGSDIDRKKLLGSKTLDNKIYGIDNPIPYNNIIKNVDELEQHYSKYNKTSCICTTKMKSIDSKGNINKFHPSYVELCYDEMN